MGNTGPGFCSISSGPRTNQMLSLPLIQEGQLSVSGKRMCTSTS